MSEPTKHGLRLTPDMARALARQWLAERMDPAANVTHDQQNQLSESVAKRLMDLARDHQPQVQQLFDYTFQGVLSSRGQFTPETGQKLAEKASPLVPALHEFTDNVSQDARKILNPDEMTSFEKRLQREHNKIDNFDTKMQNWAQGRVAPGEQPFADLDADSPEPNTGNQGGPTPAARRATRRATFTLSSLGPPQWEQFLSGIKQLFNFDEDQTAKAGEILAKYKVQADQIMTPEWRKAIQQNRIKYNLRGALPPDANGPWIYHLDQEFNKIVAPVNELGEPFRKEILALVTDLQRAAVAENLGKLAAAHGLKWEITDKTILGLNPPPASQGN